jgi:sugar O-acyltransferase (sialic acid O-acetyltransferase NeuD family)
MRQRIVGLGAGTHAKSVLEAIRSAGAFEVVALVDDDPELAGSELLGVPITGTLKGHDAAHAFLGVGGIGDTGPRRRAAERLLAEGFELPPILHATAAVSPWATLGRGAQVLATAVVNAEATLGDGVLINTAGVVEHDCAIGDYAHVAPNATLGGGAVVGAHAHVGMGAVVIEGKRIGASAFVAAGAVVVADVPDGARVGGVPARAL